MTCKILRSLSVTVSVVLNFTWSEGINQLHWSTKFKIFCPTNFYGWT